MGEMNFYFAIGGFIVGALVAAVRLKGGRSLMQTLKDVVRPTSGGGPGSPPR